MLVNIFGKRGAGKTVMIRHAIALCEAPVVVLDILGNFEDLPDAVYSTSISDTISKIEAFKEWDENESDRVPEFTDEPSPVIVLQPADPDEAINYVSAALWHSYGGTLVIDEADGFDIHNAPCFDEAVRYGRNRGVHILTGCRRPAEISRNITAGANKLFIFQTQEPRDIEYFRKTILGDQALRLTSLPAYHGLYVDYDKKTTGLFKTLEDGECIILTEEKLN